MQDVILPDRGSLHQRRPPGGDDDGTAGTPTACWWARREELVALGLAVRRLRGSRMLSQEALGDRARLHRNYVGAIERGQQNMTFRVLLKLTHGLGVTLSELATAYERQRMAQLGIVPPSTPGQTSGSHEAADPPSVVGAGAAGSGSADPAPSGPPTRQAPQRSAEPPAPRLRLLRSGTPTRRDLVS